jgi:hypothetical protein
MLRRVQNLMRRVNPNGDPAMIFDRALTLLLEELQRKRYADTWRPQAERQSSAASRHIRAKVRRTLWRRDERTLCVRGRSRPLR